MMALLPQENKQNINKNLFLQISIMHKNCFETHILHYENEFNI